MYYYLNNGMKVFLYICIMSNYISRHFYCRILKWRREALEPKLSKNIIKLQFIDNLWFKQYSKF